MVDNTTTLFNIQGSDLAEYGLFILLGIASLAIILNSGVLVCLLKRKKSFQNYGYWFQLVVLAGVDLCNGVVSLSLAFLRTDLGKTNYIACSALVTLFIFAQINTLCTICGICVNRFRCIQKMKRFEEKRTSLEQKLSVILASFISSVFCIGPFLVWDLRKEGMEECQAAYLFGTNERYYKMYLSVGIFVPWIITNILYGICVVKLKRSTVSVTPASTECQSGHSSSFVTNGPNPTVAKEQAPLAVDATAAQQNQNNKRLNQNLPETNIDCSTSSSSSRAKIVKTSATHPASKAFSTTASTRFSRKTSSQVRREVPVLNARRNVQIRAIKFLGIILVLNNFAAIAPLAVMLRDVIVSDPDIASYNGLTSLGFVSLSLNSLIDAFVYGFYTKEIRSFIVSEFQIIRRRLSTVFA